MHNRGRRSAVVAPALSFVALVACGSGPTATTASSSSSPLSDPLAVASAPAATNPPQSDPLRAVVPDDVKTTMRNKAVASELARSALGDGLSGATPTDVAPWYSDSGGLAGYTVHLELAHPQDVPAANGTVVPGIPGPSVDVTSVWLVLNTNGDATSVSIDQGRLAPGVTPPTVDTQSSGE
jgi:hypothetical protein